MMGYSKSTWRMALLAGSGLALAATATGAVAFAQSEKDTSGAILEIHDFIGTIKIIEGSQLSYELDMGDNLVDKPNIQLESGKLLVDGDNDASVRNCKSNNDKIQLKLKGGDLRDLQDFPELVVTLPAGSNARIGLDSGLLKAGDLNNLELDFSGCGDAYFSDVKNAIDISIRGSGDVTGKSSHQANVSIKGSGDFEIGDVSGPVNLDIAGSGDAKFGDISQAFKVKVMGSGDVRAKSAAEVVSVEVKGSGDVEIDGGTAKNISINVFGSGDVEFNGTADDVSVLLKGSGDVYVARLTGKKVVERHGSGDVRIGSWSSDDRD